MLRRGWERFKQRFSLLKVGKDFEPYLPSVEGWSDPSKPAYRYPAPASQFQPVPPTPEELRFDTAYYKRQNVDARVTYMGKKAGHLPHPSWMNVAEDMAAMKSYSKETGLPLFGWPHSSKSYVLHAPPFHSNKNWA